jgi:hypothetical protein
MSCGACCTNTCPSHVARPYGQNGSDSWLHKTWLLVHASLTETGITGWVDNDRGVSFMFGADVVA